MTMYVRKKTYGHVISYKNSNCDRRNSEATVEEWKLLTTTQYTFPAEAENKRGLGGREV